MSKAIRTERGWAGHSNMANRCLFRRNTLLQGNGISIVISTVGLAMVDEGKGTIEILGADGRYFETMAFYSLEDDNRYHDANIKRRIYFDSPWAILEIDADDRANEMHEAIVEELSTKIENGSII